MTNAAAQYNPNSGRLKHSVAQNRTLWLATAVVWSLVGLTTSAHADGYGAIAVDLSAQSFGTQRSWGTATGYSSSQAAGVAALRSCRQSGAQDCQIVYTFSGDICAASDIGGDYRLYSGAGPSFQAAQGSADRACFFGQNALICQPITRACNPVTPQAPPPSSYAGPHMCTGSPFEEPLDSTGTLCVGAGP